MQNLDAVSKTTEWSLFIGKPFNITVIQGYAPTTDAKEAKVDFLCEDFEHILEPTPKKKSFSAQGVGMKSKKSRETQNKRQVWPWSMKWSRANDNRVLPGEHTGHSKYLFPKTWDRFTHRHHQMVTIEIRLIMFFTAEDGEALYSQ